MGELAEGGPSLDRSLPHRWWTPVRVLLAVAVLVGTLGLVTKAPCAVDDGRRWFSEEPVPAGASYARLCASELPREYATTGLAEGVSPWDDAGGRWPVNAVSAPVGALQVGTAAVVQVLAGTDVDARSAHDAAAVEQDRSVRREAVAYTGLVAIGSLLLLLLALVALARASRPTPERDALRPWPAWERPIDALLPLAGAPVLALLLGVGWDLVGVAVALFGLAAWTSRRPVVAGVLLALATLTAWWPLAVLVVLGASALMRQSRAAGRLMAGAVVTLGLGGAASYALTSGDAVVEVLRRWLYRDDGVGSVWAALRVFDVDPSSVTVAAVVIGLSAFAGSVALIYATRTGNLAETSRYAFMLLAALMLVGTTYAPGYALVLLPFAVLAHPVWRDLLIWQAFEVFLVVATWWHVGEVTKPVSGAPDVVYAVAIVAHLLATLWLVWRMQLSAAGREVAAAEQANVLDELRR